ncbi:MAG TPA: hypothetical protein DCQ06_11120 [Myxococcales bacterium]|nr:hypothetical protein [Myxococcales bacterium]HAN32139.1 hypothetical protein [Myxococcales bacterium]
MVKWFHDLVCMLIVVAVGTAPQSAAALKPAARAKMVKSFVAGALVEHSPKWCSTQIQVVGARLQKDRADGGAYEELARALFCAGRAEDAIAVLKKATIRAPKRLSTAYLMAQIHVHLGDVRAAHALLKSLDSSATWGNRGAEQTFAWLLDYWMANTPKKSKQKRPGAPVADDLYSHEDEGAEPVLTLLLDDLEKTLDLPIVSKAPWSTVAARPIGFAAWVKKHHPESLKTGQVQRDLTALMLTSLKPSAMLFEALGDLLRANGTSDTPMPHAASWSYLRAAELTSDKYPKMNYLAKAGRALVGHFKDSLRSVHKRFDLVRSRHTKRDKALARNEARSSAKIVSHSALFGAPVGAAQEKALGQLLEELSTKCEKGIWGNPRQRKAVPKAQRRTLTPKATWWGHSVVDLVRQFGMPICAFRGQWLWPLHGDTAASERAVWLKFKAFRASSVIRVLESPAAGGNQP